MTTKTLPTIAPAIMLRATRPFDGVRQRQPQLAATAQIFLVAIIPCLLAMLVDERNVNGVSGWIKPAKFLFSLAIYYATLAWYFGYLPLSAQRSRAGRFVIWAPIAAGSVEMAWMITAATNGVPSHFNRSTPVWSLAYSAAGIGAVVLIAAILVQGIMIARDRTVKLAPAFRLGLVLAAVLAFAATLVTAGAMAHGNGHWVGGIRSDAGGLPLLGWSRSGGDLRVAHFWALHIHQLLPFAAWLIVRSRVNMPRLAVIVVATALTAMTAFTFAQAMQGRPFIS